MKIHKNKTAYASNIDSKLMDEPLTIQPIIVYDIKRGLSI